MPGFFRDVLVDVLEVPFLYLLEEVALALGSKWIVSLQNDEQKYA